MNALGDGVAVEGSGAKNAQNEENKGAGRHIHVRHNIVMGSVSCSSVPCQVSKIRPLTPPAAELPRKRKTTEARLARLVSVRQPRVLAPRAGCSCAGFNEILTKSGV